MVLWKRRVFSLLRCHHTHLSSREQDFQTTLRTGIKNCWRDGACAPYAQLSTLWFTPRFFAFHHLISIFSLLLLVDRFDRKRGTLVCSAVATLLPVRAAFAHRFGGAPHTPTTLFVPANTFLPFTIPLLPNNYCRTPFINFFFTRHLRLFNFPTLSSAGLSLLCLL